MRSIVNILVLWALILVAMVAANGKDPFDHQTTFWHDLALAEVWIGRGAINIGNVRDEDLYNKVRPLMPQVCNDHGHWLYCNRLRDGLLLNVETSYVKDINAGEIDSTQFGIRVSGQWKNVAQRDILWDGLVRVLQRLSVLDRNCYDVPGHGKFCNAPDFIRINMPMAGTAGKSEHDLAYMRIKLYGDKVYGEFRCCQSRGDVDGAMDSIKTGFLSLFAANQPWSRDVKCLIYGSTGCEGCGSYCDACGYQCPKLDCPTCS